MGLIISSDSLETNVVEASSQLNVKDAVMVARHGPCIQFRSHSFLFFIDVIEDETGNKF